MKSFSVNDGFALQDFFPTPLPFVLSFDVLSDSFRCFSRLSLRGILGLHCCLNLFKHLVTRSSLGLAGLEDNLLRLAFYRHGVGLVTLFLAANTLVTNEGLFAEKRDFFVKSLPASFLYAE